MSHCRLRSLGIVNALGSSAEEVLARVLAGDQTCFTRSAQLIPGREVFVGMVGDLPGVPPALHQYRSRNVALALAALKPLEEELREAIERYGHHRIGIIVASSTSGISEAEEAVRASLSTGAVPTDYSYRQQEIGSVSEALALVTGVTGPCYTVSTACSASAKVFQSAKLLLEREICDAVLLGGIDSVCRLTVNGFSALELISPDLTNPFSKNRSGITIGEGACLFLMTREEGGVQLLGVGESSDAYHMSSPDPEARGATSALTKALDAASISPARVTYLNLHGTGTVHNDSMEAKAISALFGNNQPWMSGTKPLTGHLLGASGATEVGVCWLSLNEYLRGGAFPLPPHLFDGEFDSALPPLNLVTEPGGSIRPTEPTCVTTSFGFGGSNCVVVLGA